jgi:hypothetical protein
LDDAQAGQLRSAWGAKSALLNARRARWQKASRPDRGVSDLSDPDAYAALELGRFHGTLAPRLAGWETASLMLLVTLTSHLRNCRPFESQIEGGD